MTTRTPSCFFDARGCDDNNGRTKELTRIPSIKKEVSMSMNENPSARLKLSLKSSQVSRKSF
eukprot:scaffold10780_cov78-Cyclotella_meneghiniana.AAC.16